uniref:SRCR domain-containing protein n=1 Tax=Erpetoichthys calabaricus TaxID=27687 RepID=A0A8C4RE06_ERPCA
IEIMYGDTWGTVCDDDWDLKDVKVVCRQLRCGEAVSAELEFGGGSGVIWLNKVKCRGTEAHLWDCQHEPLGKNDCVHKEDAGVKCTDKDLLMVSSLLCHFSVFYTGYTGYRLVNGTDSCSGRVELQFGGKWGTVCDQYWTLNDANVLCHQLKCGYAIEAPGQARFGEGSGEIWADIFGCEGSETHLSKCPISVWGREGCTHANDAGVICSYLKLVNGRGPCEGRVEVLRNGQWGTVCDHNFNWDMKDAAVVCRQLGCGEALSAPRYAHFGGGTGRVLMSSVNCKGQESALKDCQSDTYYSCGNNHYFDVSQLIFEFDF